MKKFVGLIINSTCYSFTILTVLYGILIKMGVLQSARIETVGLELLIMASLSSACIEMCNTIRINNVILRNVFNIIVNIVVVIGCLCVFTKGDLDKFTIGISIIIVLIVYFGAVWVFLAQSKLNADELNEKLKRRNNLKM